MMMLTLTEYATYAWAIVLTLTLVAILCALAWELAYSRWWPLRFGAFALGLMLLAQTPVNPLA